MHSYLHDEYGRLGFIITRDEKHELFVGPELEQTRILYNAHRVLVIKLTGKYLCSLLSKLRSAERLQKGDPSEHALTRLLDTYVRAYFGGAKFGKGDKARSRSFAPQSDLSQTTPTAAAGRGI